MPERRGFPLSSAAGLCGLLLTLAACGSGEGPMEPGAPAIPEGPEVRQAVAALPTDFVEVRKRMVAREPVSYSDMRGLADLDDGYAAWLLAERLRAQQRWDLTADMAHYYAVAAASGRPGGLVRLREMLARPEFAHTVRPERLDWLESVLLGAARRGDTEAAGFLVDSYTAGQPFGRKPDAALALLAETSGQAGAKLALDMATGLIRADGLQPGNAAQVRSLLEIASAGEGLETRITSANLRAVLERRAATGAVPAADVDMEHGHAED